MTADDLDRRMRALFTARDEQNRRLIDPVAAQMAVQGRPARPVPRWMRPTTWVMAGAVVAAAVLLVASLGGDDTSSTEIPPVTAPPVTAEPEPTSPPTEPPPPETVTERTVPSFPPTTGTSPLWRRPGPDECVDLEPPIILVGEPGRTHDTRERLFDAAVHANFVVLEQYFPAAEFSLSSLPSGDTWEEKAAFRPDLLDQIATSLCEGGRENADGSITYPAWYGQEYDTLSPTQQGQIQRRLALIDVVFDPSTIFMESGAVVVTIRDDGLVTEMFTWWD